MATMVSETRPFTKLRWARAGMILCQGTDVSPNEPENVDIATTYCSGGLTSSVFPLSLSAESRHQSLSDLIVPSRCHVSAGTESTSIYEDASVSTSQSTTTCLSVPTSLRSMQKRPTCSSYNVDQSFYSFDGSLTIVGDSLLISLTMFGAPSKTPYASQ